LGIVFDDVCDDLASAVPIFYTLDGLLRVQNIETHNLDLHGLLGDRPKSSIPFEVAVASNRK
ncbi:hypothetical protein MJD09_05885, partial [bacterium]|nr:hypothetical protein [bacterium]